MEEEEVRLAEIGNYTFRLLRRPDGTYRSEPLPQPKEEKGIPLPVISKEQRVLAKFESHSKPGEYHYVIQTPLGNVFCTCFGFRSPDKCWHYRGTMEIGPENIADTIVLTNKDFENFPEKG